MFQIPVMSGFITSPYGERADPLTGVRKFHHGIDFAEKEGTVILAARDGVLKTVAENGVRGKYMIVDAGDGTEDHYWHLKTQLITKTGLKIRARQALGLMGNTGRTTKDANGRGGYHLHFETRDIETQKSVPPGPFAAVLPVSSKQLDDHGETVEVAVSKGVKVSNVALSSAVLVLILAVAVFLLPKGV